jgi:hypothetical protein
VSLHCFISKEKVICGVKVTWVIDVNTLVNQVVLINYCQKAQAFWEDDFCFGGLQ